jgi:hypothetical protein
VSANNAQQILAPAAADIDRIARALLHAGSVVEAVTGRALKGTPGDLALLQAVLDSGQVEREATHTLQSLGIAFGKVFVNAHDDYDWWMVEDEYGRDPAIRYRQTSLLVFPQTMISKRVEEGQAVAVQAMYEGLAAQLAQIIARDLGPD